MEKASFVKNGVLRLPPGFRFHPTDEELVVQYLRRKVLSCPLPPFIIPEVDVCKSDPWDLPGDKGQERYFFSTREAKYPNGRRSNRATVSGYWKATGQDKAVTMRANYHAIVGRKRTLVFYRGKPPHDVRTNWVMHEYRLVDTPTNTTTIPAKDNSPCTVSQNKRVPAASEDWVLCRIFLKKRGGGSRAEEEMNEEDMPRIRNSRIRRPVFYDFIMANRTVDLNLAPSSSSGSSDITDISGNRLEEAIGEGEDEGIKHGKKAVDHEEDSSSSSCCDS